MCIHIAAQKGRPSTGKCVQVTSEYSGHWLLYISPTGVLPVESPLGTHLCNQLDPGGRLLGGLPVHTWVVLGLPLFLATI